MSKEQALGLDKNRKKFDIREEYYVSSVCVFLTIQQNPFQKLSAATDEDWEQKRVPRPKGVPEWGVPPTN